MPSLKGFTKKQKLPCCSIGKYAPSVVTSLTELQLNVTFEPFYVTDHTEKTH